MDASYPLNSRYFNADSSLWDSLELPSTTTFDGSIIIPDNYGRCLRRALDTKIRKLRTLFAADEEVSGEMDRIVCRLMKLALRFTSNQQQPPPPRWLQSKLLDLLTLTEKTIERRKKHFIENFPLGTSITLGIEDDASTLQFDINKIKDDTTGLNILKKYRSLLHNSSQDLRSLSLNSLPDINSDVDVFSAPSAEVLKDIEFPSKPGMYIPESTLNITSFDDDMNVDYIRYERTQAWIDEKIDNPMYSKLKERKTEAENEDAYEHNIEDAVTVEAQKYIESNDQYKWVPEHDETNIAKSRIDSRHKNKSSKTKTSKKLLPKKSSYRTFLKKCNSKDMATNYGNSLRCKRKVKLHATASKPIPESLIQLCHPEMYEDKGSICQSNPISDYYQTHVAATEAHVVINMVTAEREETIELQRNMGTDAEIDTASIEKEIIDGNITNVSTSESCANTHNIKENFESQTIFLNDINEPSTSKGLRHVSMDVQCGTDAILPSNSMLSATTSLTRLPKIFTAGIKMGDSLSNFFESKIGTDFGTSMFDDGCVNKQISPRQRSNGIVIKDSDTKLCNSIEMSTMTIQISEKEITTNQEVTETKLLNEVPLPLNVVDSGSEFCSSVKSWKNPVMLKNSSLCPSGSISKSDSKEALGKTSPIRYVKPKLSCGGVHVHSYKEKQISEDVIYQGEWQRQVPECVLKKKSYSTVLVKKIKEPIPKKKSSHKREIMPEKKENKVLKKVKTPFVVQNSSATITKTDTLKKPQSKVNSIQNKKINKNASKVTSKTTISSLCKNNKTPINVKMQEASFTFRKECEKNSALIKYLPSYLRKGKLKPFCSPECLNRSIDSAQAAIKTNKVEKKSLFEKPKIQRVKRDMLKYTPPGGFNFVVLRNEIDKSSNSADPETIPKDSSSDRESNKNRSFSPISQNSSSCSSNSVATVRAACKSKIVPHKLYSTPANNLKVVDTETNSPTRSKKVQKKARPRKTAENDKENIPSSSSDSIDRKDYTKNIKNACGKNKNVIISQIPKKSSPMQMQMNSKSQHRAHIPNKSSIKVPIIENSDEKELPQSSSKTSKLEVVPQQSTPLDNVIDTIALQGPMAVVENVEMFERNTITSDPGSNIILDITDDVINEWVCNPHNSTESHMSNIISVMRRLVEDSLDLIEIPNLVSDIDAIVLSGDHNDLHCCDSMSPISIKTVFADDGSATIELDIESTLGRTFDTIPAYDSFISDGSLSFGLTSITSNTTGSKTSDTGMADSESDGSPTGPMTLNGTTVHDIYERKGGTHLLQNPVGMIASEAFSGFSVNAEPAGDRPDYVNLVDSETGSRLDAPRQVNSEEVYVSGRSSESCYDAGMDEEDAVVPDWLFRIISQQHSIEIPDSLPHLPVQLPLPEPLFDANGNVLEVNIGAGAGAGDGCGIHSDRSQDSSGRGTSLTSSASSSSGTRSEVSTAIMIDPSTFNAQFDLGAQNDSAGTFALNRTGDVYFNAEDHESTPSSSREGRSRTPALQETLTSDVDGDVSSLDTDVPDSSDN